MLQNIKNTYLFPTFMTYLCFICQEGLSRAPMTKDNFEGHCFEKLGYRPYVGAVAALDQLSDPLPNKDKQAIVDADFIISLLNRLPEVTEPIHNLNPKAEVLYISELAREHKGIEGAYGYIMGRIHPSSSKS